MYQPRVIPLEIERKYPDFIRWLRDELGVIERAQRDPQQFVYYAVNYAEPKNPQAGYFAYADGTTWNPGSGEGLYRYSLGGAWVFVG